MMMALIERIDVHPLAWAAVCVVVLIAAITDLCNRRIHNVLTLPFFALGLIWALLTAGMWGVGEGMLAALLLGFPFIVLFFSPGVGLAMRSS